MKTLSIVWLVLLLVLMTAVPVQAGKPDKGKMDFETSFDAVDCAAYGGGTIVDDIVFSVTWVAHYDKAGNWTDSEWHYLGVDRLRFSTGDGPVVEGHFSNVCHVTFAGTDVEGCEGQIATINRCTGMFWNIQLPGFGTVYHESGLWTGLECWPNGLGNDPEIVLKELKRAGLTKQDFATLCSALR